METVKSLIYKAIEEILSLTRIHPVLNKECDFECSLLKTSVEKCDDVNTLMDLRSELDSIGANILRHGIPNNLIRGMELVRGMVDRPDGRSIRERFHELENSGEI